VEGNHVIIYTGEITNFVVPARRAAASNRLGIMLRSIGDAGSGSNGAPHDIEYRDHSEQRMASISPAAMVLMPTRHGIGRPRERVDSRPVAGCGRATRHG
jgi:hypothetical protein